VKERCESGETRTIVDVAVHSNNHPFECLHFCSSPLGVRLIRVVLYEIRSEPADNHPRSTVDASAYEVTRPIIPRRL
jgi:hypothetical protein